jgi:hypothetical protein
MPKRKLHWCVIVKLGKKSKRTLSCHLTKRNANKALKRVGPAGRKGKASVVTADEGMYLWQ